MEALQSKELILQSLEHERGSVKVYETALECVIHEDLKGEWEKYLQQTRNHVRVLTELCNELQLNPEEKTPGTRIVHEMSASLESAMREALSAGEPQAAQLVACECIVLAETKDHLDWELIGVVGRSLKGTEAKALKGAYEEIEEEEDEHLYHGRGWCRELWLESLGLEAVLPPPEEKKHVKDAIAAARTEKSRTSKAH